MIKNGTFFTPVLLNCFRQQFLHFLLTRLLVLAAKILILKMNRTCKILLCGVSLVAYSEFSHVLVSCESQNFYCGCDSYGSHIMLASFFQRHEAAIKEIVDTSFALQCYCKNLCSWEVCDFC